MKTYCILAILAFSISSFASTAQNVEIQGEAKVTQMTTDNKVDDIVVRKPDGTLATRSAQSLPSSFVDTTRTLNTDFDLAKHICECGTDFPPFLVESLLDAGYSPQDLTDAGVPLANILNVDTKVYDIDGNAYETVTIGTQTWFKTGLRVTQYNDGTAIQLSDQTADWHQSVSDEEPAYCFVNGDANLSEEYGYIYSSYTTLSAYNNSKEVCPDGWTVPKSSDFNTLITYLDVNGTQFDNVAGAPLKEPGLDYWTTPNLGANNLSGFGGLASGSRLGTTSAAYFRFGLDCTMMTKSTNGPTAITLFKLSHDDIQLSRSDFGFSNGSGTIRCIKEL